MHSFECYFNTQIKLLRHNKINNKHFIAAFKIWFPIESENFDAMKETFFKNQKKKKKNLIP